MSNGQSQAIVVGDGASRLNQPRFHAKSRWEDLIDSDTDVEAQGDDQQISGRGLGMHCPQFLPKSLPKAAGGGMAPYAALARDVANDDEDQSQHAGHAEGLGVPSTNPEGGDHDQAVHALAERQVRKRYSVSEAVKRRWAVAIGGILLTVRDDRKVRAAVQSWVRRAGWAIAKPRALGLCPLRFLCELELFRERHRCAATESSGKELTNELQSQLAFLNVRDAASARCSCAIAAGLERTVTHDVNASNGIDNVFSFGAVDGGGNSAAVARSRPRVQGAARRRARQRR